MTVAQKGIFLFTLLAFVVWGIFSFPERPENIVFYLIYALLILLFYNFGLFDCRAFRKKYIVGFFLVYFASIASYVLMFFIFRINFGMGGDILSLVIVSLFAPFIGYKVWVFCVVFLFSLIFDFLNFLKKERDSKVAR